MKSIIAVIIIMVALLLANDYEEPRDYTNLTVTEAPYPDIAIDVEEEYKDGYLRLLWTLGKK